jgi:hypothetical protein
MRITVSWNVTPCSLVDTNFLEVRIVSMETQIPLGNFSVVTAVITLKPHCRQVFAYANASRHFMHLYWNFIRNKFKKCGYSFHTPFLLSELQMQGLMLPITVAARSKALTLFSHSNAGILGSNPAQDMYVCVRLFCV